MSHPDIPSSSCHYAGTRRESANCKLRKTTKFKNWWKPVQPAGTISRWRLREPLKPPISLNLARCLAVSISPSRCLLAHARCQSSSLSLKLKLTWPLHWGQQNVVHARQASGSLFSWQWTHWNFSECVFSEEKLTSLTWIYLSVCLSTCITHSSYEFHWSPCPLNSDPIIIIIIFRPFCWLGALNSRVEIELMCHLIISYTLCVCCNVLSKYMSRKKIIFSSLHA